jgi:hypothetical protein
MLKTASYWQRAMCWLEHGEWAAAEGALLQLLELGDGPEPSIHDALGYALLMQGEYHLCEFILAKVSNHPDRSFWVSHKLGDALRGQHQLVEAASWYERSLQEGSISSLTYRNLIQVLWSIDHGRVIIMLEQWLLTHGKSGPWLEGVHLAADLLPEPDICLWLNSRGLAGIMQKRRLIQHWLYQLNLDACFQLVNQDLCDPWIAQVGHRLDLLLVD